MVEEVNIGSYDPSQLLHLLVVKVVVELVLQLKAGDGISWIGYNILEVVVYNPPSPGQYDMGGGGSGYRGGGDGWNSGVGHSGKSGGGAGYHDTSLVPAPSITKDNPVFPSIGNKSRI